MNGKKRLKTSSSSSKTLATSVMRFSHYLQNFKRPLYAPLTLLQRCVNLIIVVTLCHSSIAATGYSGHNPSAMHSRESSSEQFPEFMFEVPEMLPFFKPSFDSTNATMRPSRLDGFESEWRPNIPVFLTAGSQESSLSSGETMGYFSGNSEEDTLDDKLVPVVPIQLPPPNDTIHYHYADDADAELKFETDFSKIIIPFSKRAEKSSMYGYLGSRNDKFVDMDFNMNDELGLASSPFIEEKFEDNMIYDQSASHTNTNIDTASQRKNKKSRKPQSHSSSKSLGRRKEPQRNQNELIQDVYMFESKKLSKLKKRKKKKKNFGEFVDYQRNGIGNDSSSKIFGLSGGTSLEEVSMSLNFDNGDKDRKSRKLMRRRPRRSVVHLYDMVVCATGCNPLAYKGYGCYCGFLGSGLTVDGIDRCCAKHDWCYHHAKCPPLLTYFVPYYWTCNNGRPRCVTDYRGWKGVCGANLCECDRAFAECLRQFACPRSRAMCMTSPFRFWQNLLIHPMPMRHHPPPYYPYYY